MNIHRIKHNGIEYGIAIIATTLMWFLNFNILKLLGKYV